MDATDIIARLDRSIPRQAAHIASLQDLVRRGERYSNEGFDIRSAALAAIGKSEVPAYMVRWVEIWAPRAR